MALNTAKEIAAIKNMTVGQRRGRYEESSAPNREYNARWEAQPAGQFRHRDGRFECTRAEFQAWAGGMAECSTWCGFCRSDPGMPISGRRRRWRSSGLTDTAQLDLDLCQRTAADQPYPLLFVTISGAHLYGFPSADSDYDLRGVHILPAEEVLSLEASRETIICERVDSGRQIDLVTHDVGKFFRMLTKNNGYAFEQLLSPLIVHTTTDHEELRRHTNAVFNRAFAHHYLGFAENQWSLALKRRRLKPLLYVYRVLLTGIHLMRTGELNANLPELNAVYPVPGLEELIARKLAGAETGGAQDLDWTSHEATYTELQRRLEAESANSPLPETTSLRETLSKQLVDLRLRPFRKQRAAGV